MTYVETSRDLPPLESGNLALEDQFCGWLWMRGTRLGRWRHRYFCLDGTMLSYFTSFPAEVFLKQAQASVASAWASRNLFHFGEAASLEELFEWRISTTPTGLTVIDIRAHDSHERNRWLRALKTPARRKSRSWSTGSSEEVTVRMSSFDPDGLCRFDRLSIPIIKSGWMEKKTSFLGLWRRYFFVVQGSMLSYYNSDKPYEVPRWRGYVEGVKARRRSGSLVLPSAGTTMAPPTLELIISLDSPQNQVIHVRFRSLEEAREWRRVLRANLPERRHNNNSTRTA
ncbi:PH domain-like [Phytophthora cactorum]|nr:PH domain-like [Phytophthora cactorum]